jgi:hypothetical protein
MGRLRQFLMITRVNSFCADEGVVKDYEESVDELLDQRQRTGFLVMARLRSQEQSVDKGNDREEGGGVEAGEVDGAKLLFPLWTQLW